MDPQGRKGPDCLTPQARYAIHPPSCQHPRIGAQAPTSQWTNGKSADTLGPIGPWLVTADEVTDWAKLDLWLDVYGRRFQKGTTGTMVFGVPFLVSYLSRCVRSPVKQTTDSWTLALMRRAADK